jgi:oxygen-independent coproporphyrinogen III oxidase
MPGIYIHIPFCRKACHYCNFHFSTNTKQIHAVSKAIAHEASLRKDYITRTVETIYFGGGTPSLLEADDLKEQIGVFRALFNVAGDAEITLESNPDDITPEKLEQWKEAGINRLSIGVQSFFAEDLQWMNRAHNATQAEQSILFAQQAGFDNITIDLIYGTPTLTDEQWKYNVDKAISLGITHLSCYALTVEAKTALADMIKKHKIADVSPDKQGHHFELLMQWLEKEGWEHYEISNFAKPGHRSKHNSSYWKGESYLGLGPSAHSFNGISRQWNIANNALYLKSIEQEIIPFEIEMLTPAQRLNEYIMTSLRTMEGLSLQHVKEHWSEAEATDILRDSQKFIDHDLVIHHDNNLLLTRKGKLMADGIAADLFRDNAI